MAIGAEGLTKVPMKVTFSSGIIHYEDGTEWRYEMETKPGRTLVTLQPDGGKNIGPMKIYRTGKYMYLVGPGGPDGEVELLYQR